MPHPAADFQSDQTRWFLEGCSITSLESAMAHLCRGWLEFTPAVAVFLYRQSFAEASACFLRAGNSPQLFSKCSPGENSPESAIQETLGIQGSSI